MKSVKMGKTNCFSSEVQEPVSPYYEPKSAWPTTVFPVLNPNYPTTASGDYEQPSPYSSYDPFYSHSSSNFPPSFQFSTPPETITGGYGPPSPYPPVDQFSPHPSYNLPPNVQFTTHQKRTSGDYRPPSEYPAVNQFGPRPSSNLPPSVPFSVPPSKKSSSAPKSTMSLTDLLEKATNSAHPLLQLYLHEASSKENYPKLPSNKAHISPRTVPPSKVPQSVSGSSSMPDLKVPYTDPHSKVSNFVKPSKRSKSVPSSKKSSHMSSKQTPLSNGSELEPPSEKTPYVPLSKGLKSKPKSKGPKILPPSEGTPNVPSSNGLKSKPKSNGSKTMPPTEKTPSVPSSNGLQPKAKSKGSETMPPLGETQFKPSSNGLKSKPKSKGSKTMSCSEKTPFVPSSDGFKPNPKSKGSQSEPVPGKPSKVSNSEGSSKHSKAEKSSKVSKSPTFQPSNKMFTKLRYKIESKVPCFSSSKKQPQTPKLVKPIVFTYPRPDEKSGKRKFVKFATVVYHDLLKLHENTNFEDLHEKFPLHKAILDLFLSKRDFFKTGTDIIDPGSTNFYQLFFIWGLRIRGKDMSEEELFEFIIKVCCCAISVQSEFPALESIVQNNAIEAIADICVGISKDWTLGLKLKESFENYTKSTYQNYNHIFPK